MVQVAKWTKEVGVVNALFSPLDALLDRYCVYLLYWYTSTNTDTALFSPLDALLDSVEDASSRVVSFGRAVRRYSVYLLY